MPEEVVCKTCIISNYKKREDSHKTASTCFSNIIIEHTPNDSMNLIYDVAGSETTEKYLAIDNF